MSDLVAVVTTTEQHGRESRESEVRVTSLQQLFEACREAPPSHLVRVALKGPEGEVRLNFASFFRNAPE